ncbi:Endoribonuclease YbeY [Thalassovita gelatinovora]|uniref:Endoribonuclease YbeY n=1 Tax=Thalassovita gelatinovora TaxID=53501 RepID=A0A0P1G778_THAGE|nr:rRNA maturation RNase YbeY [Thalassovita gelatinovora]QIZ81701.1 rRNA maturation RNase YbeY [Thalassovita gelatinovora]CUH68254.1 Endoribonuclease YbeY [Thalassovita gelatinovora]SEQ32092.1 probable rRNA maturation factor [Thalassovita gelatinovora]
MLTDTILEDDRWQEAKLDLLAESAARAALVHLGLAPDAYEIAVLGCDDARIADLNADFREKPTATNVLSWPSEERGAEIAGDMPDLPKAGPAGTDEGPAEELGDIAISYETCLREAMQAGKPLDHHITHLMVHAVLHLLGYDHIRDKDATLMEGLEIEILGKMGLPDPYRDT